MKIKEGYILRKIAGEDVVIPIGGNIANFNGVIRLNESAAFLWKKVQEEVDKEYLINSLIEEYEMATRSVKLNNLEDRVEIVNADIKSIDKVLEVHGYHVVTSNPPYMHMDGIKNPNDKKAISRHEVKCNLEDVIRAASRLVMPRGKFFMIHRPTRLVDIIELGRKYRLEPKVVPYLYF